MNLTEIQSAISAAKLTGWLVYDFRGSNPIFAQFITGRRFTSRRAYLWIPAAGEPTLLMHPVDGVAFADVKFHKVQYGGWNEMQSMLRKMLSGKVAMEYSPCCELPAVSYVDAGTVELIRSMNVTVVSSADLISGTIAAYSPDAFKSHMRAGDVTAEAMREAFNLIRKSLMEKKPITELDVQKNILDRFARNGMETVDPPIVAVNGHGSDPHFSVSPTHPAPIHVGDWILIDLWVRVPGDHNVYSDITWVGYCGKTVPAEYQKAYDATLAARDASMQCAVDAWKAGRSVHGWELDEAARGVFIKAGYEKNIRHRTGHSLSPGPKVHGLGMNLDNIETRDTRIMQPRTGFTIEPALYFSDGKYSFGVRSEINVYVDPKAGPIVSSCMQEKIELLG